MPDRASPAQRSRTLDLPQPVLALAPMQDVTDLAFWNLQAQYGEPDLYFTPYFRVHATSRLNRSLLASITQSPPHRRIVAQIIGQDIPALVRTARELQQYPVAAVDLNLGCPAPIVCRKRVGGGLLRHLDHVDAILAALRAALSIPFTVKTRLGYGTADDFDALVHVLARHSIDLVTLHCRTVKQMYEGRADHRYLALAVRGLSCPVLANGDLSSPGQALTVLETTGVHGLMIGRGAVRNPWLFAQIRCALRREPVCHPTGRAVRDYIEALYHATRPPGRAEGPHIERMKKYLNFIGPGVEPTGRFLHQIRRVTTEAEFFRVCSRWLDHEDSLTLVPK
jgi:tRNA-dihydrouridine synthase